METVIKKEIKMKKKELIKRILFLIVVVSHILLILTASVKYFWMGDQPTNFTMLMIILGAIGLDKLNK